MKRAIARIAAALASILLVATQFDAKEAKAKEKTTGGVEQALMQMERDWTNAALKNDSTALDRILADDWTGQGPLGTFTKAQVLADAKSGDAKTESETMGEMKVRVFGNTAVVTGSDDEKSSYKGKDTSGHYVWMDVFVKRNGRWQAAASQSTLNPAK